MSAVTTGNPRRGGKELARRMRRRLIATVVRCAARTVQDTPVPTAIIAPHPDDEVFGCGGLIASRRAAGAPLRIIFLSSGGAAHVDCCAMPADELSAARRRQALDAGNILGVPEADIRFMNLPDGQIPASGSPDYRSAADELSAHLAGFDCREVYCTHALDVWPDHRAADEMARQAIRDRLPSARLRSYLVWGWYGLPLRHIPRLGLRDCVAHDIGPMLNTKLRALDTYVTRGPDACPHPYVGALPDGFLEPFIQNREVFFDHANV